jgi:hypothetical protein
MSSSRENRIRRALRSRALSPVGLLLRALLIGLIFCICEGCGLRQHATFLSGTTAIPGANLHLSTFLGAIYLATYFAFVLLAPILVIAAVLLAGIDRCFGSKQNPVSMSDHG